MNRLKLIFIFFVAVSSARAQSDTSHNVGYNTAAIIYFYPCQLISGEVRFSFEYPFKRQVSVDAGAGYIYGIVEEEFNGVAKGLFSLDLHPLDKNYHGFTLRGGIKIYRGNEELHTGFFFKPLIMYKYLRNTNNFGGIKDLIHMFSLQALIGDKTSFGPVVTEIYGGPGIKIISDKYSSLDPRFADDVKIKTSVYFTLQMGASLGVKVKKKLIE